MENIELSKGVNGCAVGQMCNCATLSKRIPPCLTQYSVMVTDDLTRTDTCSVYVIDVFDSINLSTLLQGKYKVTYDIRNMTGDNELHFLRLMRIFSHITHSEPYRHRKSWTFIEGTW
jgi:hypothetical protein